ncbi:MAG: CbtB-domain containing protein [Rhodospirillaceae bacterium]|jgi:cobalt transporter subunit CbtB|nr:CbtB-domain containing protein [Rhodospirillaceae bacterium]MBT5245798.1 CbtB-domain containing protein [Rhodospirillaceae bacterium]MBT5561341.1 CbtB-domain containing protein [Rhodospirillaceae bacterium]MBT6242607.1 CbtB-domain containing protein [Rhodospirillaceae bacterium]MBT7136359.1 CbtB-domain containing protein [Rhodospirillaceae bacterium]
MQTKTTAAPAVTVVIDETVKARVLALIFGAVILFSVGFAYSTPVHNAAHDTRHTLAFPCH